MSVMGPSPLLPNVDNLLLKFSSHFVDRSYRQVLTYLGLCIEHDDLGQDAFWNQRGLA